jgi:hypothetical protein
MKKIKIIVVFIALPMLAHAQRNSDLGLIAGTDFYLGDINPDKVFLTPRYMVGPVIRYNFNKRYAIRFQAVYANLAGDENPDRNITKRPAPVSFSVNFVNVASQVEYNFFDYKQGDKHSLGTPYVFGGLGYSVVLSSKVSPSGVEPIGHYTMPFGVGAKFNITRRLSSGLEWSLNKNFSDRIDGVISPLPDGEKLFYGNDWYSFLGLFITYKFFKFADDCPAYD